MKSYALVSSATVKRSMPVLGPPSPLASDDVTVDRLLRKGFYRVPAWQRYYVWEAKKEVSQLLEDLSSSHNSDPDFPYFLGNIVLCGDGKAPLYDVVDGQQRLTTLWLVLCAMRDYLRELGGNAVAFDALLAGPLEDGKAETKRVELQYEDSDRFLSELYAVQDFTDRKKLLLNAKSRGNSNSIRALASAYQYIYAYLALQFPDEEPLRRFLAFLLHKTQLVRLETSDVRFALRIYETINGRGRGLSPSDLLLNFLFMKAALTDYQELHEKWTRVSETLNAAGEKRTDKFLRAHLLADGIPVLDKDIYRWYAENPQVISGGGGPTAFLDRLLDEAVKYGRFMGGEDSRGAPQPELKAILALKVRQHYPLLLASSHLSPHLLKRLYRHLEGIVVSYILTKRRFNELEKKIPRWCILLRQAEDEEGFTLVERELLQEKADLAGAFEAALKSYDLRTHSKAFTKIFLARLDQFLAELAGEALTHLEDMIAADTLVSLIALEDPPPSEGWEAQEDDIYKLGNATLLEKSVAGSIPAGARFSSRKPVYRASVFLMNQQLVRCLGDAEDDQPLLHVFHDRGRWGKEEIGERQQSLVELAIALWGAGPLQDDLAEGSIPVQVSAEPVAVLEDEEDIRHGEAMTAAGYGRTFEQDLVLLKELFPDKEEIDLRKDILDELARLLGFRPSGVKPHQRRTLLGILKEEGSSLRATVVEGLIGKRGPREIGAFAGRVTAGLSHRVAIVAPPMTMEALLSRLEVSEKRLPPETMKVLESLLDLSVEELLADDSGQEADG